MNKIIKFTEFLSMKTKKVKFFLNISVNMFCEGSVIKYMPCFKEENNKLKFDY